MPHTIQTLAFFGLPGGWEWIIILLVGVLLFGRRLPEVGRSLGRSVVEFKKGIQGIEEDINSASDSGSETDHQLESQKKTYANDARSVPQGTEPNPGDPPAAPQQPTA